MSSIESSVIGRLAALEDWFDRVLSPRGRRLVVDVGLFATFAIVTLERIIGTATFHTFAIDLRIYRAAAEAALLGADPWATSVDGLRFAGPPPTLLAYVPAAAIPESLAIALYGLLSVAAALLVLRALRLPIWWLLFPPISDSLVILNPDIIVVALLVAVPRLAALSVPVKVYAIIPLALTGNWRPLIVGIAICFLSIPWWPDFLAARGTIETTLATQSFGGASAWGTWLMVPTTIALATLWRRGAEWLAVPALWPYTQLHYSSLALPVAGRNAVVAFLLCFPVAFLAPLATIWYAIYLIVSDRILIYRSSASNTEPSASS